MLCTKQCPPSTAPQFSHWELVSSGDWNGFRKCVKDCSGRFVKVDGKSRQCVDFCGATKNDVFYFEDGNICASSPCEVWVSADSGRKCLKACPTEKKYFDAEKGCTDTCESYYYYPSRDQKYVCGSCTADLYKEQLDGESVSRCVESCT